MLLGIASLLSAFGAWTWRLVRGPARRRSQLVLRLLALGAVVLPSVLYSAYRISKARTFQFFGEIVPRVETSERVVALTFDDGPVPGPTDQILSMLGEEHVRATFFLNGQSIERHPAEAEKVVRAGHEIGNHTYSHAHLLGKPLSFVRREIERTDELIREVAGYTREIHFRSPFGKKLIVLPYYLWRSGRQNIFWDVEPESYGAVAESAGQITEHVTERVRPGSIILLHVMFPGRATSLEAVPGVISELKARGYRFVTVSELLEFEGRAEGVSRERGAGKATSGAHVR